MRESAESELILVRHGETLGESTIRLNGSTDVGLSDHGRRQMERVRDALRSLDADPIAGPPSFDRIYVSPLSRSIEGAAIVFPEASQVPEVVEAFTEIDFGIWEGLTAAEVRRLDPIEFEAWKSGRADWSFPGGDSRTAFHRRVATAARRLFVPECGRVLAILHKGVIKTIIGTLIGLRHAEYSVLPCELGSIHHLRFVAGAWRYLEPAIDHLGIDRLPVSR